MPRGSSKLAAAGFGTCLLLLGAVFALSTLSFRSPEPLGPDAPQDAFSAARARVELVRLLGDETPHPIGSTANHLVKARLVERLTELGFTPLVQDAIGCGGKWPVCGHVENVLARIDGEQKSGILLMTHYDSVPYAPGAGDDGAGVATLLEVARILRSAPKPHNSILFAFTDGEEPGLLGAEAFFSHHPWANDVAVVINLEGSGSSGPALLLRSGPRSGLVVDAFRSVAKYPVASSFSEELFKHLPNDTDFSVSSRFGKPGVDFAFAGERNHYHTLRDTVANLSPATLQHHGENVLPLVRALMNADLSKDGPNYVYATLTQSEWLAYRPAVGLLISIFVVVALAFATWRRWQGLGHFSAAFGIVALAVTMIVVLELVVLALADLIAGTRVSWPANPWPWRMIIYSVPIVGLVLQRPLVRRIGFWNTLLAGWWLWALLTLALAWYLPLASHLLLPAVGVATIVIVVLAFAHTLDRPAFRCSAAIFNALVAGFFMLPLAYMGEITQGLVAAPVMYVPLALVAVTLLPLLDRGRVKLARSIASLVAVVGVAWVHWAPLYSEQRPQYVNVTYALDADSMQATYLAWSPNVLPSSVADALPFAMSTSPVPWSREKQSVAPATVIERATTEIEYSSVSGTTRTLHLRPGAATDAIEIAVPADAQVSAIRIDGQSVAIGSDAHDAYRIVRFVAPPPDGFSLEIDAPDQIDAYLIDSSHSLPDSARSLTQARGRLAVPVHQGDRWIVYRRLKL
jgi:hypothetical protein